MQLVFVLRFYSLKTGSINQKPSAASHSCLFVKMKIQPELLKVGTNLNRLWRSVCPPEIYGLVDHTDIGEAAWGQLPTGAMSKVLSIVGSTIKVSNQDVLLDWGFGLGRWLIFGPFLLGVRDLVTVGLEKNKRIFQSGSDCLDNVNKTTYRTKTSVANMDSSAMGCFCGATIVINYDGGIQATSFGKKNTIHLDIMTAIFRTPSVRVVVSTKLDFFRFQKYFPKTQSVVHVEEWELVRLRQPGGQYGVSIWFRKSSQNMILPTCNVCINGNNVLMKQLIDKANAVVLPRMTRATFKSLWYLRIHLSSQNL